MVAVEVHAFGHAFGALNRLDPLTHGGSSPDGTNEAKHASLDVGAVVLTQHRLDRFGRFVGVVPRHACKIVVDDMGLDDAMHEVSSDKAKFTVDGGSRAAGVGPGGWIIVGKSRVGMLQICDPDFTICQQVETLDTSTRKTYQASYSPKDTAHRTRRTGSKRHTSFRHMSGWPQ